METVSNYVSVRIGMFSVRFHLQRCLVSLGLAILLLACAIAALAIGSGHAGFADALAFLTGMSSDTYDVVGDLRAPRVAMALACGAMLGLSGAALQALTRNGLADPGFLGVREGASLAVIVTILSWPAAPLYLRPIVGMAGGLTAALFAMSLARSLSHIRFILIGIGISWFLSAIIALILVSADIDNVQAAMIWMAGSLSGVQPTLLPLAWTCLILGGGMLVLTVRAAEASLLGEITAIGLGVRTNRYRLIAIIASVLMTAAAVSCAGSLGFVGLLAPHLSRFIIGGGQAALLSGSALIGAGLVLLADTLGRTLFAPVQIPAGIVLSVLGVVLLVGLLWQRRHHI
ncbi:iron ABC transporter permease [Agrobacterium cavarae]|uniref:FecCD family ABC transporter permease n=1 Tax=Agrobacterium cavarae TaxID=2528239 RepID=UPI002FDA97BE